MKPFFESMKAFYESLFYFNAGACVACFVCARLFTMPQLFGAALAFALGAICIHIGIRWGNERG